MHKSFINFRYIGKFTNRPVVSFFCRLVLIVCRDDFSSSKIFRKNTDVDTVIIVISYNWSKNIANFFKVTLFPKTGFTVFQNFLESLTLPNSKFS